MQGCPAGEAALQRSAATRNIQALLVCVVSFLYISGLFKRHEYSGDLHYKLLDDGRHCLRWCADIHGGRHTLHQAAARIGHCDL